MEASDLPIPDKKDKSPNHDYSQIKKAISNLEGTGLTYQTFEDIGKYTVFPERHWRRMFPRKFFGQYEKDEFSHSKTFGIMTREEGLKITNELSRLTLPHERNVDYQKFINF